VCHAYNTSPQPIYDVRLRCIDKNTGAPLEAERQYATLRLGQDAGEEWDLPGSYPPGSTSARSTSATAQNLPGRSRPAATSLKWTPRCHTARPEIDTDPIAEPPAAQEGKPGGARA
jgi:hypothetical protein